MSSNGTENDAKGAPVDANIVPKVETSDGTEQEAANGLTNGIDGSQISPQRMTRTSLIISQTVLQAINQLDTKLAFEMMMINEKITSLENENKILKEENIFLKDKVAKQNQEEADIYHYLHDKLDRNMEYVASLEKELENANTKYDQFSIQKAKEMDLLNEKHFCEIKDLTNKIDNLEETLKRIQVFREQKNWMEDRINELEIQLDQNQKKYQEEIQEIDRKTIQEKDRLKKEMLIRIKETKQNLLSMTEDQLHTTTKRTIMENDQAISELQYQSKETEKLLIKYKILEEEVTDLKLQLKTSKETEQLMAKKMFHYQKLMTKMNGKIETEHFELERLQHTVAVNVNGKEAQEYDEVELMASLTGTKNPKPKSLVGHTTQNKQTEHKQQQQLTQKLQLTQENLKQTQQIADMLQKEKSFVIAQQDEVVNFLLNALNEISIQVTDTKRTSTTTSSTEEEPHSTTTTSSLESFFRPLGLDKLTPAKTQEVLQLLLDRMKSYQEKLALVYRNQKIGSTREQLERQFGVELPPISPSKKIVAQKSPHQRSDTDEPSHAPSPLKPGNFSIKLMNVATSTIHFGPSTNSSSASPPKNASPSKNGNSNALIPSHSSLSPSKIPPASSQFTVSTGSSSSSSMSSPTRFQQASPPAYGRHNK